MDQLAAKERPPGRCHMKGNCGKKSVFSPDLPCSVDVKASTPQDQSFRDLLVATCGADFAEGDVCCTQEQVENLSANLQQAEPLISSCPACRNNFRSLFCSFTCSPDQSRFVDVAETQKVTGSDGKPSEAVKTVNYYIDAQWKQKFFDSCKNVKFGASNGFAMDLIGGGAQTPNAFLKFLGDEKPLLGSPFQINFPDLSSDHTLDITYTSQERLRNDSLAAPVPFNKNPRQCGDPDLLSRCACVDCPDTCTALPELPPSNRSGSTCSVGSVSCFTFSILLLYMLLVLLLWFWRPIQRLVRGRRGAIALPYRTGGLSLFSQSSGFERVRMGSEDSLDGVESRQQPGSANTGSLVGARGIGHFGEESSASSAPDGTYRGIGLEPNDNLSALGALQPRKYALNQLLTKSFYRLGFLCASHPWLTFLVAAIFVGVANIGWKHFEVEVDPVRLWVAPGSTAKAQKDIFDQEFGPFYRPQQVFLMDQHSYSGLATLRDNSSSPHLEALPPALSWDRLLWLADLEKEVRELKSPSGVTLQDVCLSPAGPGTPCVVQSILGYFQDDPVGYGLDVDSWAQALDQCGSNPAECLPTFGQPLRPNIVLGGLPDNASPSQARSAVVTYVLNNSLNTTLLKAAEEWERELLALLEKVAASSPHHSQAQDLAVDPHPLSVRRQELGIQIAFSTGVSLETEIGSSSNTDVGIVVLSYLTMFVYVALTLGGRSDRQSDLEDEDEHDVPIAEPGSYPRINAASTYNTDRRSRLLKSLGRRCWSLVNTYCVTSKFTLGLFGIVIVLCSVSCAVGIFSAMGVKVTLIIAEVIPFMLLAVGVDNIFLLCNEMDRQTLQHTSEPGLTQSDPLIASGAPSMGAPGHPALSPTDEMEARGDLFMDGRLTASRQGHVSIEERAARCLARVGPSILLSATTQIVAFLLGAVVPMPAVRNFALYAAGSMLIVAVLHCTVFIAAMTLDAHRVESGRIDCLPCIKAAPRQNHIQLPIDPTNGPKEGSLDSFIRYRFAPTLLRSNVKRLVVVGFGAIAVISSIGVRRIEMGLDQRLALPSKSYLRPYFDAIDVFLDVGPPLYLVAAGEETSERQGQRDLCGRFTTCEPLSLANTLEGERQRPQVSWIAEPASSWIDDFLQWLNPILDGCCRVKVSDPTVFCGPHDSPFSCQPCFEGRDPPWNITMDGLPEGEEFYRYLRKWLESPTDQECPLGGQAAYSSALSIVTDPETGKDSVRSSHFRTYFAPLRSQSDFISALEQSQRISNDISDRVGYRVFPYSLFFIFFEQYTYLLSMAVQVLGSAAIAIFAINTVLLGSWRTGAVVTLCVASAVFLVAGAMGFWGIQFNALTLVNLSVCAAIGVEFCAHIARAFMRALGALPRSHPMSQKERDERAWLALTDVGGAVVNGIFSTKLIGVGVLIFTKSDLLKLYYAKTWLCLIVGGLLHGLILLPVLLSWLGGRGWSSGEDESDVKRRLNRAGSEYRPMMASEPDASDEDEDL
ncbi:related to NCR1-transmembrane glycoprotein, involved in sphingolipid metabolism [Sporisorium reilianum f. sp. reilianum]|uniref:Related to NCR1-transmembrane glycoprotein, involved in sphingolipid metabolism n=1 Tax=Sporisorium reilianum f. sp. reilianum TaxID=72559 RepID=A0A2N8UA54_9BASI|nr:related to NCR1-transmembrane glycoprotein, involved in sphingolipid metabolism [Sporisorium reilianum f. sp. reilianum]